MARKTFGEMMADSRGAPIRVGDLTIHGIHRFPVVAMARLMVRFVQATPKVRQALRLTVNDGALVVNRQTLKDVVLWADTAPRRVQVQVMPSGGSCVVKIWNAWQDEAGAMQAWIGDCGMLVDRSPVGVRLQCSDGVGGPDFSDLIVEVAIVS